MDNDLLVVHLRFLGRVGEVHRITWMKNNITETLRCMQETIFAAGWRNTNSNFGLSKITQEQQTTTQQWYGSNEAALDHQTGAQ